DPAAFSAASAYMAASMPYYDELYQYAGLTSSEAKLAELSPGQGMYPHHGMHLPAYHHPGLHGAHHLYDYDGRVTMTGGVGGIGGAKTHSCADYAGAAKHLVNGVPPYSISDPNEIAAHYKDG